MYLRKIRPRTTCLYSDGSMWPRILSAAAQRVSSKPRLAAELLLRLAMGVPVGGGREIAAGLSCGLAGLGTELGPVRETIWLLWTWRWTMDAMDSICAAGVGVKAEAGVGRGANSKNLLSAG